MAGNVWEWNMDLSDSKGAFRVIRGGSWNDAANLCRWTFRYGNAPNYRGNTIGFRLARSVAHGP